MLCTCQSVGMLVGLSHKPCATDNSRTLCPRSFILGRKIFLDEKMISSQVSRSKVQIKSQAYSHCLGQGGISVLQIQLKLINSKSMGPEELLRVIRSSS